MAMSAWILLPKKIRKYQLSNRTFSSHSVPAEQLQGQCWCKERYFPLLIWATEQSSPLKKGVSFLMDLFEYSYTVILPTVLQKSSMENPDTWAQRNVSPAMYLPATESVLLHNTESSEHTVLISISASLVEVFYSPHKRERPEQTWILSPCEHTRANKIVLQKLWLDISRPCQNRSFTILWKGSTQKDKIK